MWHLFVSDLRGSWIDWAGIFLVALVCGFASGWSVLLISSSYGLEEAASRQLLNAGTATVFLTWIASVPISVSVSKLVARKKESTYSAWRLLGMRRRYAGLCFFAQMTFLSLLGLVLGIFVFGFAASFLDESVSFPVADFDFLVGASVVGVELLAFVLGGLGGVLSSWNASPLLALGVQGPPKKKLSVLRFVILVVSAICLFSLIVVSVGADPISRISCLVFLPLVVSVIGSLFLRPMLPWTVRAWTMVVPWKDFPLWRIARSKVLYYSNESTAIQMPIAIGISLVSGLVLVVEVLLVYLGDQGIAASGISFEQLLSFFGAPISFCIVGAVAAVAISASDRAIEGRALISCGASYKSLLEAMVSESFIQVFNALLVGMACALISGAISSAICSVCLSAASCLAPSLAIFLFSFVVVLLPMLTASSRVGAERLFGCKILE